MVTYATITGLITVPSSDVGIRARLIATPLTAGTGISLADRLTWGPAETLTANDGTFTDLNIPLTEEPVLWQIVADPVTHEHVIEPWTVGVYEITASGALHTLVSTDVLGVNPSVVASINQAVEDAETARDETQALRDGIIGDLGTTDSQTATLINGPSLSSAALSATFVAQDQLLYDTSRNGVVGDGVADDTATVQALIDGVPDGATIWAPVGSVLRTDGWTVTAKSINLDFSNADLVKTSSTNEILEAVGEWDLNIPVTSVLHGVQSAVLTVASTTGYQVGDLVKIFSDDVIADARYEASMEPNLYRQGQFGTVTEVTGTTIKMVPDLVDLYTTGVRVARMVNHAVTLKFKNAYYTGSPGTAFARGMFKFEGLNQPSIAGRILEAPGICVAFRSCYRYEARLFVDKAPVADGYGISDAGCEFGEAKIHQRSGRHAWTDDPAGRTATGNTDPSNHGRSMYATVRGSTKGLSESHWDTHHGGRYHSFENIKATGSPVTGNVGFSLRGEGHQVVNPLVADMAVAVRLQDEDDAGAGVTCFKHVVVDLVTRNVAQVLRADLTMSRQDVTIPNITLVGGVMEFKELALFIRRCNLYVEDSTFRMTDADDNPFTLSSGARMIGSWRLINAMGTVGEPAIFSLAEAPGTPSLLKGRFQYVRGAASDGAIVGILANNAEIDLAWDVTEPWTKSIITSASADPIKARTKLTGASSSALVTQTLTDGSSVVAHSRVAHPAITAIVVNPSASTRTATNGVGRGCVEGQQLTIINAAAAAGGGGGNIVIPAAATNLELGTSATLTPGSTLRLVWETVRATPIWVRA